MIIWNTVLSLAVIVFIGLLAFRALQLAVTLMQVVLAASILIGISVFILLELNRG